jgi:hypothetical protein
MMTQDQLTSIKQSLESPAHRDAHRLYEAALTFTALAALFDADALRAVSDKLAHEARDARNTPHERELAEAMALYLALEETDGGTTDQ